jgi:prepilin-type processing-associated H-X9-DG protein
MKSGNPVAKRAYMLACLGPCAFWVLALDYPLPDLWAFPPTPRQLFFWLVCLCSPLGMLLGVFALLRIHLYSLSGAKHAWAAIIVGSLASVALLYGTRNLLAVRLEHPARVVSCLSNIKQLDLGMLMYAQDYDDHFPLPKSWNDGLMPYVKNEEVFRCPSESNRTLPSYGMNWRLGKVKSSTLALPGRTVLLFDALPGKNQAGGQGLLPDPPRHPNAQNIGFADGHAKSVAEDQIEALRWKPTNSK